MDFVDRVCKAVRIDTSWREGGEEELRRFQRFLPRTFPAFHKTAERRVISPFSVVYRWPGAEAAPPVLFLAHYDVVPAEAEKWSADPFGAEIREDGGTPYLYGRGTLDMKSMLMAILESAEELCKSGFVPKRDIWFAFGGDEERAGITGAKETARLFSKEGRHFAWILDEGSPVMEGQIKGIEKPLALVSVGEKGFLSVDLTVEQKPGHASQPPRIQAAAVLARALFRIGRRPFPFTLDPVVKAFFRGCAEHSGGIQGLAMRHARLLGPLFFAFAASTPVTAAMLRTTTAMTMLAGSAADNVMPSAVQAVLNLRLLPPWTVESALARIVQTVADDRVAVTVHGLATNPVPASPGQELVPSGGNAAGKCAGWDNILEAMETSFPGVPVLPFLMTATTDSRHYRKLAGAIYRFNPQRLNPGELSRIHGHDERISLENLENCRRFYFALMKTL
jgi:carboxypeptidase PM20D1